MKGLMILLLLAVSVITLVRYDNVRLKRSVDNANALTMKQRREIQTLQSSLQITRETSRDNERAQAVLRQRLALAQRETAKKTQTVMRLLNENKELRDWYDYGLPDDVIRVHERPACDNAADASCKRLSGGHGLPDA